MSDSRFDARAVVAAMLGVLCIVHAPHDTQAEVQAVGDPDYEPFEPPELIIDIIPGGASATP